MNIKKHLRTVFADDNRCETELEKMFDLMELFYRQPEPPDPLGIHSSYKLLKEKYEIAVLNKDSEIIEESFLQLYCAIHGNEAPYTSRERILINKTGGYWCHAGGISPIVKAYPWISKNTVSADFGAGNGIQGLLLQWLYPHKKTVQIEISSKMIESGKELQKWLSIPESKIQWISDDIMNHSPKKYDFIYLYRPLKPEALGIQFYSNFASDLSNSDKKVTIFSIADCLEDFLPPEFSKFYSDGHLTCFKN
ncbi:MAG: hypothetical protein PVI26_13800 [Chitinispirillia bacterium]|jgi:hypothetical protein